MTASTLTPENVKALNAKFERAQPLDIIRWAADTFRPDVAVTSSFGADSAALLHLAVQADPTISIRTVDTGLLFPETYQFIDELRKQLRLNLTVIKTRLDVERFKQEHAHLPVGHPDFCCSEYKVEAMERALAGLRCWITGISRSEAKTRAHTPIVDVLSTGVVKVAPLATWTPKDYHAYLTAHRLPYHPLWLQGYTSIGCWPCTQRPADPNDPRSGRWAGQDKTECGIHDIGKPTRKGSDKPPAKS